MLNSAGSPPSRSDSAAFDVSSSENDIETETVASLKNPRQLARISGRARIAVRRFDSLQMPQEKILKPPLAVGTASAVTAIGDEKKIEIFARANQGIHKAIRAFR